MSIEPFEIGFSQTSVDHLRNRLAQTRWPDEIAGSQGHYGVDLTFMLEICDYWRKHFDWAAQLKRFSAFDHFRYISEGFGVHFIHERGKGPAPLPLVLTHGWPGSFIEMLRIIPLLTDPEAHGGDAKDAFDVVVPSLPGFGYSDRPTDPGMNIFRVADLWAGLMSDLGYLRFAAQGGDIGAGVSTALALRHANRIIGVHFNYIPASYRPYMEEGQRLTEAEEESLRRMSTWFENSGAYAHIQRTRPQSAAYALNDSPAGLAAWILEKFREWSDCDGDLFRGFDRDDLLANVTLYWMTETIHSSFRIYFENRKVPLQFKRGDFVHVPCAVAHFPKEIPIPAREFVERGCNLVRWNEMPRGGHFAAMEVPDLLAADVRAFFRPLRR